MESITNDMQTLHEFWTSYDFYSKDISFWIEDSF